MQTPFRLPLLTALILTTTAAWSADAPVKGCTLIYLEQQAHTNLYPPAGGFYPNGGILNQITDKLTWQNPKTLQVEPWVAESWTTNADKTEYTFKIRPGITFSDGTPLDANAVAKNFDTYGLGNKAQRLPVSEVINNYDRSEVVDPLLQKGGSSDKVKSFRDDKLNALLVDISAEVDPQKRLQLTGDAQRYLLDNAYVIPIFEEPQVFAGAPWLKGVNFEAVGRPSFYGAWLEKH